MSQAKLNFSRAEFDQRLMKTRQEMQQRGIDLLIVSDPSNMNWLTGYDGWSFYVDEAQKLLRKMSHQPTTEVVQIAWKEKLNPQILQFQNKWGTTPVLEEALQKFPPHAY